MLFVRMQEVSDGLRLWLPFVERASQRAVRERSPEWRASPALPYLGLPTRVIGAMGEYLVEDWAAAQGLAHHPGRNNMGHDCTIEGLRVEVKFASLAPILHRAGDGKSVPVG